MNSKGEDVLEENIVKCGYWYSGRMLFFIKIIVGIIVIKGGYVCEVVLKFLEFVLEFS